MRTFLVEQAVMKTENETTSFCTVSKLGLLDKFGEDCFFFFCSIIILFYRDIFKNIRYL